MSIQRISWRSMIPSSLLESPQIVLESCSSLFTLGESEEMVERRDNMLHHYMGLSGKEVPHSFILIQQDYKVT